MVPGLRVTVLGRVFRRSIRTIRKVRIDSISSLPLNATSPTLRKSATRPTVTK